MSATFSGESTLTGKKWKLSTESKVVIEMEAKDSLTEALALLFALHYNLNLQYQNEAALTLEFIQRLVKLE